MYFCISVQMRKTQSVRRNTEYRIQNTFNNSSSASSSGNGTHRPSSAPPTACASSCLIIIIIITMHFRPCTHAHMLLKGFFRNTEIQKYICHQAFTQSIQSTSRGLPHTGTCTVQDSPPPQRRSALRTIVIVVIILCTHAEQGHQASGSCNQHIHQGAGA